MKEELLYFLFEFTKRDQAFDVCYKNITADDNAYSGPILVYNEGKNMIISYSSFTRATLLSVLTLDATSGIYKSQLLYDTNAEEMKKYEMIEPV